MSKLTLADLNLEVTSFAAPLQIEGVYKEVEVYYRSRHGNWTLDLNGVQVDGGVEDYDTDQEVGAATDRITEVLKQYGV